MNHTGQHSTTELTPHSRKHACNNLLGTACADIPFGCEVLAHPLEVVHVWLGQYEAGASVPANYSTQAVEFDLTNTCNGSATIDDTLCEWVDRSDNTSIIPGDNAIVVATNEAPKEVVDVSVTFSSMLSAATVIHIGRNLSDKMTGDLKPKVFKVSGTSLTATFDAPSGTLSDQGTNVYEDALNAALNAAKEDPEFDLTADWSLKDTTLNFYFDL
jgi:hypothetical protein